MKYFYLFLISLSIFACSDFDEQPYTVLLPDAGQDLLVFTEETGTTINIDGSNSSDVNEFGFDYQWTIESHPEGFPGQLNGADTATPNLVVNNEVSGRYVLSLVISRGEQQAKDFMNIDVNPQITQVLFVNAIQGSNSATLSVPSVNMSTGEVSALSAAASYLDLNLNVARNAAGNVEMMVDYNGNQLTTEQPLTALGSYTVYLVGTADSPELHFVNKTRNQNTIPVGLVSFDAINLVDGTDDVVLYIDATAVGIGVAPIDQVFTILGVPETFGGLGYKDNKEIFFPANSILPLPIWATVNGTRISNDVFISLTPSIDKKFGTFILYKDDSAANGHQFVFLNNSELLP